MRVALVVILKFLAADKFCRLTGMRASCWVFLKDVEPTGSSDIILDLFVLWKPFVLSFPLGSHSYLKHGVGCRHIDETPYGPREASVGLSRART